MLYSKFIFQVKEKTIKQLDNGTWYLEPEWKDVICREIESDLEKIEDNYLTDWWDIENVLRLEVEKRNAQDNKLKEVVNWFHENIFSTVDSAIIDAENKYVNDIIDFMKTSKETPKA